MSRIEKIKPIGKLNVEIKKCPYCHVSNIFGEICNKCVEKIVYEKNLKTKVKK